MNTTETTTKAITLDLMQEMVRESEAILKEVNAIYVARFGSSFVSDSAWPSGTEHDCQHSVTYINLQIAKMQDALANKHVAATKQMLENSRERLSLLTAEPEPISDEVPLLPGEVRHTEAEVDEVISGFFDNGFGDTLPPGVYTGDDPDLRQQQYDENVAREYLGQYLQKFNCIYFEYCAQVGLPDHPVVWRCSDLSEVLGAINDVHVLITGRTWQRRHHEELESDLILGWNTIQDYRIQINGLWQDLGFGRNKGREDFFTRLRSLSIRKDQANYLGEPYYKRKYGLAGFGQWLNRTFSNLENDRWYAARDQHRDELQAKEGARSSSEPDLPQRDIKPI